MYSHCPQPPDAPTRANGDRLRNTLLSRGGSTDAMQMFRNFTGSEPDVRALVKRRGL